MVRTDLKSFVSAQTCVALGAEAVVWAGGADDLDDFMARWRGRTPVLVGEEDGDHWGVAGRIVRPTVCRHVAGLGRRVCRRANADKK
jgi:hypothetical protein